MSGYINFELRKARPEDKEYVLECVQKMHKELSGSDSLPDLEGAGEAFDKLISNEGLGCVYIAVATGGDIAGIINISRQYSITHGGQYAIIQELWLHETLRSISGGMIVLRAVEDYCIKNGIKYIEAAIPALPGASQYAADFYKRNGYFDGGKVKYKRLK
jgi:GNAT superfamily N-acetyltransferase